MQDKFHYNDVNNIFSYDGVAFHRHSDAKTGHVYTTLANYDGSPFAVGGSDPDSNKVEVYDISTDKWSDVLEYPYHDV